MATLLAHITIREASEARFERIARELYERTHTLESGVLRYEYWRGADERTYYAVVSFVDHREFIAHQASDHHEAATPALGEIVESIRLEWVDPVAGASDLPATESQPAPDDAGELISRYTDIYAAAIAGWWNDRRD